MAIDIFSFVPYGKVKLGFAWSSNEYESENGTKLYCRKRVHAKKTYSFTVQGIREDMDKLIAFYNKQHGQLNPFFFEYDGIKDLCYFTNTLSVKQKVAAGEIQMYTCDIGLEVDAQSVSYPDASTDDVLPSPYNEFTRSIDWNVQVLEMGATQRRAKSNKPHEKLSATWSGLKNERDTMIKLFNSHCRVPLKVMYDHKLISVILPDSMEITDYREGKNIVGYSCQMEVEIV